MKLTSNQDLRNHNTFRLESTAKEYLKIESESDLLSIDLQKENTFVLGGGSNVILPKFLDKTVISINIMGISEIESNQAYSILEVKAGENWHNFVKYCIANGYYGFENLALIPGKVGAAPIQNIGAYGKEQGDFFQDLTFFDIEKKEFLKFNKEECNFSYRDSIFKNELKGRGIITSLRYKFDKNYIVNTEYKDFKVYFKQNKISDPSPLDVFNAVVEIRTKKLPDLELFPNCGSFFKNPVLDQASIEKLQTLYYDMPFFKFNDKFKIPAAWLIEKTGLKGFQIGGASTYSKHALVIGNNNSAKYEDVIKLKNYIIESVYEKFNIQLQTEVNIIST